MIGTLRLRQARHTSHAHACDFIFVRPAARPRRRSSDFSFGSAANRKKIAVGELERIAAGDGTTSPALPHEARYPLKAKAGFYWQAEVEDPWIGPFESLEEASTDGKQCCFGVI